jgi:hypothetical protein
MAVIDEEGQDLTTMSGNAQGCEGNVLISAGENRRRDKNTMHNTTSGFYPPRFGDRVPTRGDAQSRGRTNLIPSA